MKKPLLFRHKIINVIQTAIILFLMLSLFIAVGYFISGSVGMLWALFFGLVVFLLTPRVSPQFVLRMYRAIPLHFYDAPGLHRITHELAARAGIHPPPKLFYIPSAMTNAFSVGSKHNSAIAFTDGLLRRLNSDEIVAVIAHEISHIHHGDLKIMNLADTLSRFTDVFSSIGIFLLLLYFPLSLMMGIFIPLPIILLLMCAPTCSALLQLALSRAREYDADLGAVELTHDPLSLASALQKLEYYPLRFYDFLPLPKRRDPVPSILRTHPVTQKRIDKLLQLATSYKPKKILISEYFLHPDFGEIGKKPRMFPRIFRL
ncbi:MAG: zinc metalloprotease HtpX [Spirochaetes bacterium]|nr:zinc metalloprotease HtpX [Spirochaetota bacterium]